MFTGITEETGRVVSVHRGSSSVTIDVAASVVMDGTQTGDSIATDGVCLTVACLTPQGFRANVMPETVRRTTLATLRPGTPVNLERAMPATGRFGGHIVSGHIDGTGTIVERRQDDDAVWLWISTTPAIMRYIVEKGSVALSGISLTVAAVRPDAFAVSLIPHTQQATTLHAAHTGDKVNIECDVIAKYVEHMLAAPAQKDNTDLYRKFMM